SGFGPERYTKAGSHKECAGFIAELLKLQFFRQVSDWVAGFSVSFGGNFETLNGAIAANGIEFFGNAGGTIDGSVINYSGSPMTLSGNSDLFFNRSGTDQMPAGFGPEIILF
ncbi:unnamed protein product, partial [marine sediment metagenome]